MPIRTLQTIPQEPEETTLSGLLQGLAICLKTTCTRIRRRLLPLARSRVRDNRSEKHDQLLNDARRRALFERYNRLDVALYRNATAIWCAEWYNAIGDRESCVRTYAHHQPRTPSPCK